jgi:hypothetical protein
VTGTENLLGHLIGLPPLGRRQQEQILRLHIAVNQVGLAEEFEGTGKLLQEVATDDLVQARVWGDWVFSCELVCSRVCDQFVPLPDEQGQITQLAILHDKVNVGGRLDAVMEGNNMGVPEFLENLNLAIEVLFELPVQTTELDRLDGNQSTRNLGKMSASVQYGS